VRLPIQPKRFQPENFLTLGGQSIWFVAHFRGWKLPE